MIYKRFKGFYIEDKGWGISDTITNTDWLIETRGDLEEFLKVLNEQHEQIQDIQKIIDKKTQGKWKPYDEKYANDRFMVTHTGYLVDTKTEIVYLTVQAFLNFVNNDLLSKNYCLKEENEKLKEKNCRLEYRIVDMLDYIKEKGTITHQEMKEWWNTMMTGGNDL